MKAFYLKRSYDQRRECTEKSMLNDMPQKNEHYRYAILNELTIAPELRKKMYFDLDHWTWLNTILRYEWKCIRVDR